MIFCVTKLTIFSVTTLLTSDNCHITINTLLLVIWKSCTGFAFALILNCYFLEFFVLWALLTFCLWGAYSATRNHTENAFVIILIVIIHALTFTCNWCWVPVSIYITLFTFMICICFALNARMLLVAWMACFALRILVCKRFTLTW